MAENIVELLTDVADAIREKKGTTDKINAQNFSTEIRNLPSGSGNEADSYLDGSATIIQNDNVTYLRTSCFMLFTKLKKVSFSKVSECSYNVFNGCSSLEEANLPSLEYPGNQLFDQCVSLKQVNLQSLITTASTTFRGCSQLARVEFGVKFEAIESQTFQNCTSLTDVIILQPNKVCRLGNVNAFNGSAIANGLGFIYVPDDLVESYKSATNWSTYADAIKPISELPNE